VSGHIPLLGQAGLSPLPSPAGGSPPPPPRGAHAPFHRLPRATTGLSRRTSSPWQLQSGDVISWAPYSPFKGCQPCHYVCPPP
jgi:hypothetical protein